MNEASKYDLLTKYLLNEVTEEERKQVEDWLGASPENRKEFEELEQLINATDFETEPADVDTDLAWARMQSRITKAEGKGKVIQMPKTSPGSFNRFMGIAAGLVGIILVAAVIIQLIQAPVEQPKFAEIVSTNEVITDTLADGTIIKLNKNSKLTYPVAFAENERHVTIEGEAFFDVARDTAHPFIIDAGEVEVKVLGTSFNVKAYNTETVEVIVETGKVQISSVANAQKVILEPGDKGVYNYTGNVLALSNNLEVDHAFWRSRKLVFRNTPVRSVVETINKYYDAGLTYEEPVGRCQFTATFEDDSLDTILEILAQTFQLEIRESGSGKILTGNGCKDEYL